MVPKEKYVALIYTPGYLPENDDPPIFDTAAEAWAYLADERWDAYVEDPGADEPTWNALRRADGIGTLIGSTPNYGGDHDLGKAYNVEIAEPTHYVVRWEIDQYAYTPRQAASQAWTAMRNKDSIANVFEVAEYSEIGPHAAEWEHVDLMDEDDEEGE